MFSRPAFYHPHKTTTPLSSPLKGHSPAGFRIPDCLNPKRCFNLFQGPNFTDTRSPVPSPSSSPGKETHHPEDDSPPTMRLADLFGGAGLRSPDHRQSSPLPKFRPDAKPKTRPLAPLGNPPRKSKYGYKQLTLNSDAIRSCVLPHHRRAVRNQQKRDHVRKRLLEHHERLAAEARADIRHLRKEAETIMKEEKMNDEDRIFLEQLKELQLDQVLQHDLESCRDRVMRATDAAQERQQGFAVRDEVVAKLWSPEQDYAAEEARKKKIGEFVRSKEEKVGKRDAARRRREQAALRAEEARRRAHEKEERRLREEQERLFREGLSRKTREEEERRLQEARERQLQEQMERQRREAQERLLREERERLAEQERQARLLAEQVRRAAQPSPNHEQFLQHFALYEAKWNELRTSTSLPPVDVTEMPWPVFGVISSPQQITYKEIKAFVFHPLRRVAEGKTARDKVRTEVLRFHPDKFNTRVAPKIKPSQEEVAREIAGAVARILTKLMTDEIEKEHQNM